MNMEEKVVNLGRELAEINQHITQLETHINSGIQIGSDRSVNIEAGIASLERSLPGFMEKLTELEEVLANGHKALKKEFHPHVEDIKLRRLYIEERLRRVKLVHAESWWDEDFRAGILTVFDNLGERINSFGKRISSFFHHDHPDHHDHANFAK
ncbi:hypothetical conserved protein [Candidatus Nitrosoglobus terrae]|uniref:Hypothetical conserved protein n=1 Tax=Candidatus Nitrosoglobus terrae TaxID=1630141 RepID=A0A1Q2SN40_9GAMM|nr:hypothetical protein [Candidatus Nitrosoglobus terrae]BAW80550.1 hypothetical conserved protein [Candidatus Nitrosoglobus terrae]